MQKQKRKPMILISMLLIASAVGVWIFQTNTSITTSRIIIRNRKIPDAFKNFKIAHVSDLHNHNWKNKLIDRLRAEAPDIIVVTGDLVDSDRTGFAMEFISRALKLAPVYYVTGNHEAWLDHYSELKEKLTDAGVQVMDNRRVLLERGNAQINLVGIGDPDFTALPVFRDIQTSAVAASLKALLRKDTFNIVLSHRPDLFDAYAAAHSDLVLTGHAHGGQVRIPLAGGLIAPNQGFFPKYSEGVYHRDGTDMVVSRGLGNSTIPVRINNTPELVVITLAN